VCIGEETELQAFASATILMQYFDTPAFVVHLVQDRLTPKYDQVGVFSDDAIDRSPAL
jgi:predicted alpha-1,6-mannanase (GH76 family)